MPHQHSPMQSPQRPKTAGSATGSSRRSFVESMRRPPQPSFDEPMPDFETSSTIGIGSKRFTTINGAKLHGYAEEKAPYPLSYDKIVLALEGLDFYQQSVTFVDFPANERPKRILDLGTGGGVWCFEAAREFKDAQIIGFDLVDIQPIYPRWPKDIRKDRIQWVHGNFLTTRLPFEEDEFDYIHVSRIAAGVPENKWGPLFAELNRILSPGGVLELIEDDIIFPTLPRYFTSPLRAHSRNYDDNSHDPQHAHAHVLLESLYKSVYESRFINLRPTAILPSYVDIYFRHTKAGPTISWPMPPLPKVQPLPQQVNKSVTDGMVDPRYSTYRGSGSITRPPSMSFSSMVSGTTASTGYSNDLTRSTTSTSQTSTHSEDFSDVPTTPQASQLGLSSSLIKPLCKTPTPERLYFKELSPSATPSVPFEQLDHRTLGMHLYRAYQNVLATREAMYEELKDRIRNKEHQLKALGWDDDDELNEFAGRLKYDRLCERYRSDMQARVALWTHLTARGYPLPAREALSRSEFVEEERKHKAMEDMKHLQTEDDKHMISRASRVIIGYKNTISESF